MLILAAQNTVSDARMEFLIRDRQSWLRFPGFGLGAATPDANTIRLFCERLTRAGAIDTLFSAFDRQLRDRGGLPMGGQIVDTTLVAAPKAAEHQSREGGDQGRQDGSRDYELDNYLRSRGGEVLEELPLNRVENQGYIHYRKGSVVM